MQKFDTTYKEFYERVTGGDKTQYYVKNDRGGFSPVHAVAKKVGASIKVTFKNKDKERVTLHVGDTHAFMDMNQLPIVAKELKVGDSVMGLYDTWTVTGIEPDSTQIDLYDIMVDAPNWYVNDDHGIISHNTCYSLLCAKAYMDKYDDAVLLFYDSEMGASKKYFESFDIDMDRVLHLPITDIEELKFDVMSQLENIKRGDHVIIVVDSVGNLASRKEVEDALEEKSVADMTRAKQMKSLIRMITPHLNLKNIPMIMIAHTYKEMSLFPKDIISGGTGLIYGCDCAIVLSRSQEKKGTELLGYNFNLNIYKSRFVREKSRIPMTVLFDGGINKWSGLLEMALAAGFVVKPSNGWYQKVDQETGELIGNKVRLADTNTAEFWDSIVNDPKFEEWVEKTFMVANSKMVADSVEDITDQPSDEFTMETA